MWVDMWGGGGVDGSGYKRCKRIMTSSVSAASQPQLGVSQMHGFHIVDPSPWPLVTATSAFMLTSGTVGYMHGYVDGFMGAGIGMRTRLLSMGFWFRDITREGTFEGHHTAVVQMGLRMGMLLFIVSEVMFFFAFFWAFFWSALAPVPEIGSTWPPKGIAVLSAWDIPFLNTRILLSSGAAVTWAHHSMVEGDREGGIDGLMVTVRLAIAFTGLQGIEYRTADFTLADGIYGSTFYMATGFHGFHVFVGTCILAVCRVRLFKYHFTAEHHFGFEAGAWYWHFVDVVWLFLFVAIYWWGGA